MTPLTKKGGAFAPAFVLKPTRAGCHARLPPLRMSRKAFAMLEWRLKEASERFVRCHFSGFMHTVRQVDETGQVLEPRGQAIDLNVLQRAGDVALVHSCIEATGAEIDFLERSAYFYISRNPTVASLKAILITLSIGTFYDLQKERKKEKKNW